MKKVKILLLVSLILIQSSLCFCQSSRKDPSIKIPGFKRSTQIYEEKDRIWESALEDLNGDGYPDMVLTDLGGATQILLNNGKGFFKDSGQKITGSTHGIAIGDLDNDGDMDLFFALLSKESQSGIYLNNGKGVFNRTNLNLSIATSERVQLIDIDCDGDLDAYLWYRSLLYLNDGKGNFEKCSIVLPGASSFNDLNGDGSIDIFCALPGLGFKVYLNDKNGNFTEYSFLPKKDLVFCYMAFADVDNDSDIDIVYSNGSEKKTEPAGILLNDGNGRFTDSGQKLSAAAYGFIGTGDLNNDGYIDIIITDRDNPAKVWINDSGKFKDSGVTLGEGGYWNNCIIKDIDNDGDMDVFITKVFRGNCGLWFNQLIENKRK